MTRPIWLAAAAALGIFGGWEFINSARDFIGLGAEATLTAGGLGGAVLCIKRGLRPRNHV